MKKTLAIISLLLGSYCAQSQITLEHTYTAESGFPNVILFTSNGSKIMINDTGTNQVKLYNTDYTLWKTINLSSYPGYTFNAVYAISDNLFNNDNLVELVAVYSNYSLTYPSVYRSEIINETGTVLQDLGNAYYAAVHVIDGSYYLYAVTIDGSSYTTNIYSLPGTLPCGQCGSLGIERVSGRSAAGVSAPAPNPNSGQATISYTLPVGVQQGVITLFNTNGQTVKTYVVGSNFQSITLDNTTLPSGTYYYSLTGDGIIPSGNKMIIIK